MASFGGRQFVAAFVCAALSSNCKNLKKESCPYLFYTDFTFNLKLVAVSSPALGRTPDRANSSPVTRFTPLIQRPTGTCAGVDDVCVCVCVCVCVYVCV